MLTECAFFAGVGADHIGKESLLDGRFSDGYVTVSLCVAYIEQNAALSRLPCLGTDLTIRTEQDRVIALVVHVRQDVILTQKIAQSLERNRRF